MPPKRKEKKQNYIPKCAECEGWRLWWRLEFDIRAAQSSPSMTSPDFLACFLPSPRLVYSFTLRTAAPASDLFVNSFTKPLLHVPFLFAPQSFFLATTSSWSPAHSKLPLSLSHSSNLFRFLSGWLYPSISCLPVTWFVDNLFGNSVIPWTKKTLPPLSRNFPFWEWRRRRRSCSSSSGSSERFLSWEENKTKTTMAESRKEKKRRKRKRRRRRTCVFTFQRPVGTR